MNGMLQKDYLPMEVLNEKNICTKVYENRDGTYGIEIENDILIDGTKYHVKVKYPRVLLCIENYEIKILEQLEDGTLMEVTEIEV